MRAGANIFCMVLSPTRIFPLLFVVLWSTGFLGARLGLPHAEPLTFLFVRYVVVTVLMTLLAFHGRVRWPASRGQWISLGVAGLLLHGVYLAGVFLAISLGLPAGVASLVVGLQPLLTALVAAFLLAETVQPSQWAGLTLGFLGVAIVVQEKLGVEFDLNALWPALVALVGITFGAIVQKRYCVPFDWRSGAVAQFLPTTILTGLAAGVSERMNVHLTGEFVFALLWLTLVLSVGAVSLLNWLIRTSNAVNVASLFYLVPPCTALFAWILFGERLSGIALLGLPLAVLGVFLARKRN